MTLSVPLLRDPGRTTPHAEVVGAESGRTSGVEPATGSDRIPIVSSTFSSFLGLLGPDGEPPTHESFDALLATLRKALVHEMKRRALWGAPPSYLGIYGGTEWTDGELLEELLLDCYEFVFVRRLPGLRKQARVRENVDGLVFLSIRNFLHDTQRRHDPLGYRLFEVVHAAIQGLLKEGVLHVVAGDVKVRNDTVLAFAPWHDPCEADNVDPARQVTTWNDALLPELVTAWRKDGVIAELIGRIARLSDDGVEVFRFRDLIEPLKNDVRARWGALLANEDEETAFDEDGEGTRSIVRLVRPENGLEERQTFAELLACVSRRIDRIDANPKTREYLRRLWGFLRYWAAEPEPGSPDSEEQAPASTATEQGSRFPTDNKLGEAIGIPRERIPGLKATLGRMVKDCRDASARGTAQGTTTQGATESDSGEPPMALDRRREELRQATACRATAERPDGPPRPGDTFVFDACSAIPMEWLVLEEDPADASWVWVAPVDDHPLVGSRDVAVAADDGSVAHVRCAQGTWLAVAAFEKGQWTGTLDAAALDDVRRRRAEIADGTVRASSLTQEVDEDSEYRDWLESLATARAALPGNLVRFEKRDAAQTVGARRRPARGWPGYALAAAFGAASLGLSAWLVQLKEQIEQPVIVGTSATREIRFLDGKRTEMLTVAAEESHVTIYLVLSEVESFPAYRLELYDEENETVWSSEIARDPHDEFLLVLPRRLLSPGSYRIRLSGRDQERLEVLDEREIRVEVQ